MSTISTKFKSLVSDPGRCSDYILQDLKDYADTEVVDASNAFVLLLETTTHLASQNWTANALGLRKRYASLATTFPELYNHVAPRDIPFLFAQPTTTSMRVSILLESLLVNAVNTGPYREAIIPKYTEIQVDDLIFSLDRAISIRVYPNRVFKVSYLEGGTVHADIALVNSGLTYQRSDGTLWLSFVADVKQQNYSSYVFNLLVGLSFSQVLDYSDQLSSIEVLYRVGDAYVPMQLSLSARVFDPTQPTAIITPDTVAKTVTVFIPAIFTQALVAGNIKVILGNTLGDIDRVFTQYTSDDYSLNLDTSRHPTTPTEAAFLSATTVMQVTRPLDGGRDPMTFLSLRNRIVNRAFGNLNLPVSRSQFTHMLDDMGLVTLLYREGIGGRTYVITDDTPHPTIPGTQAPTPIQLDQYVDYPAFPTAIPNIPLDFLSTLAKQQTYAGQRSRTVPYDSQLPIGSLTATLHYDQLLGIPGVHSFETSITLPPSVLFAVSGESAIPAYRNIQEVDAMSAINKVKALNKSSYLFPLFYYHIKSNAGNWTVTPWALNQPTINLVDKIVSDSTLPDMFARTAQEVFMTAAGYVVRITVNPIEATEVYTSADTFCQLQLSTPTVFFTETGPHQGDTLVFDMTVTAGDSTVYECLLPTAFQLTDTYISIVQDGKTYFLESELWVDVVYGLKVKPVGHLGELTGIVTNPDLAPMLHERFHTSFGHKLDNLWVNPHGVGDKLEYLRYTEDAPFVAPSSSTTTTTSEIIPFQIDDACAIQYKPITTTMEVVRFNNDVVYVHRAGDLVLDPLGKPIPISSDIQRISFDMLFIDVRAALATDPTIIDQLLLAEQDIVHKCITVIPDIRSRALERTDIYYRPLRTVGEAIVTAQGNPVGSVSLSISPAVTLGVSKSVYNDSIARKRLQDITVQVINSSLTRDVISYDRLISDLYHIYGESVVSVRVDNLPSILHVQAVSLKDNTTRMVVGTVLASDSSNRLTLVDDIIVQYALI